MIPFVVALAVFALVAGESGREQLIHVGISGAPPFAVVDRDGDGMISKTEALSAQVLDRQSYREVDRNRDGFLSKAEYDRAAKFRRRL